MKIAYVLRAHPSNPRCTKECNALARAGHAVTFIGWDVDPNKPRRHELDPSIKVSLLAASTEYGRYEITKWVKWYAHIIKSIGFRRHDVVHCVDEYPAVMLLPFKHLLYAHMVMDVYDSIVKRPAFTIWKKLLLLAIRWWANWGSDVIIETSDELRCTLGRFARKAIVVMNSPEDPWEAISGIMPPTMGPVRIAVGGGIGLRRMALDTLVRALDDLGPERVRVLSSGVLIDDYARTVYAKHACVSHQWLDDSSQYFRQLAECDVVYGVRADAEDSEYRRLVFPQKVFDAMAVGRPIIVASENWIAKWLFERQLGYACSFRDVAALKSLILFCAAQRAEIQRFAARARCVFRECYEWRTMAGTMLKAYERLARAPE